MLGLCPHPVAVTVKGHGVQQGQKAQEHIQRPQEALEFKVLVLFNPLVRVQSLCPIDQLWRIRGEHIPRKPVSTAERSTQPDAGVVWPLRRHGIERAECLIHSSGGFLTPVAAAMRHSWRWRERVNTAPCRYP